MDKPLKGVRVIEMAGIGPGPFAGMWLADQGAEVIRVERPGGTPGAERDVLLRGRRVVQVNLKAPEGVALVKDLVASADAILEGFRPGVMERLGLGPDALLAVNDKLVYGRMTGWGQSGPWAPTAGHDMNYIALTGALHAIGRAGERPVPPLNLVGDFGGGAMFLVAGMLAALLAVKNGAKGRVVDAAMVDGAALLMAMMYSFKGMGLWRDAAGYNLLDGGAHFYDTYECADGKWLSVAPIEPQFYAEFRRLTGLDADPVLDTQMDAKGWPALKERVAAALKTRTRDEWMAVFEGTDACVAPVLSMTEAPAHPHMAARGVFAENGGVMQPNPAPRYGDGAPETPPMMTRGQNDTRAVLESLGIDAARIEALAAERAIAL